MKMQLRGSILLLVGFWFLALSSFAFAQVATNSTILRKEITTPYGTDDPDVWRYAYDLPEVEKLRRAYARYFDGIRFMHLSREDIDSIFRTPEPVNQADYSYPVFGIAIRSERPFWDPNRGKSYPIEDIGVAHVHFGMKYNAIFFLFRIDDDYVQLTERMDIPARIEWDTRRFREVMRWVAERSDIAPVALE